MAQESKAITLIDTRLAYLESYKLGLETDAPENKKKEIDKEKEKTRTQIDELTRLKMNLYES